MSRTVPTSTRLASTVALSFIDTEGKTIEAEAKLGETLLDTALRYGMDIEAACEGECACSTCHVIVDEATFAKMPEITEDEEDMLDLAAGLTDHSRLACQVKVEPKYAGMRVELPEEVNNLMP